MAGAAASSRSFAATACVLAVLLVGCLAAAADARRLLVTAMPPSMAAGMEMAPAQAPAPEAGADLAGRMLFEGRELLDGGLRLAGRLLLGLGL
ncbi:hypothetical protein PAHAL_9G167900 [Panicum hallii]|jgi:hypothetical protein|uniref:Uncharacterized protein n=1 Tax=Panicum hallii TaxID=206008 RepID=A0A2S3IK99_9POAL|nr:hypothetical protein PAHAL_9G167900 [Panicum hallii]